MTSTKKPLARKGTTRKHSSIEPGILSLVEALNATRLVKTISSSQGSFHVEKPQGLKNAFVHFEILRGIQAAKVHDLMEYVFYFGTLIDQPVRISCIHNMPGKGQSFFELGIMPKDIYDTAKNMRSLADHGIRVATKLVGEAMKPGAMEQLAKYSAPPTKEPQSE